METDRLPSPGINFADAQLQECYESSLTAAAGFPEEFRQISALIGVHEVFQLFEGPHSSRVHAAIEQLLLKALRPGSAIGINARPRISGPAAVAFGDHLSQLAGERLDNRNSMPTDPAASQSGYTVNTP